MTAICWCFFLNIKQILFNYVSAVNTISHTWKSILVFGKTVVCPTHSWVSRKAMITAKYFNICPVSEETRNETV